MEGIRHSPVEGMVVYPSIFKGFHTSQPGGCCRISEPSTVVTQLRNTSCMLRSCAAVPLRHLGPKAPVFFGFVSPGKNGVVRKNSRVDLWGVGYVNPWKSLAPWPPFFFIGWLTKHYFYSHIVRCIIIQKEPRFCLMVVDAHGIVRNRFNVAKQRNWMCQW